MFVSIRLCAALLVVAICGIAGCGGNATTFEVSGTVTYDGKPVETGHISFVSLEAGVAPDGGVIEGGRFIFDASPGPKRVEIRASRPLPDQLQRHPEMGLSYEDYLPSAYNSESELKAEVSAASRQFQFELDPA